MAPKYRAALLCALAMALGANADYLQVNLYSDSHCGNYIQSFSTDVTRTSYTYEYSGAYSFLIANCDADVVGAGSCTVYNFNSHGTSYVRGSNLGEVGNCVSYDGSRDTKWGLYMDFFYEGNS
ncbi:hypothetical protein NQ176_g3077 [Zarea fungicola]|uniref:Uncharacterized protein n=1 Tax=Zarea fungicola TaxID=93591 RepID=A0ACC1NLI8_9HYPO|nr:hypothetical protein NQ176_g3077 [Lecanicillium fungicola]